LKRYTTKDGAREYLYYRCSSNYKIQNRHCDNHSWKAEELEALVWSEIQSILQNPDVVMAGLRALQTDNDNLFQQELIECKKRLTELDREQEELLSMSLKGFPDSIVKAENKRINTCRDELKQRSIELENHLEIAKRTRADISSIKEACQLIKGNLPKLSFENKRFALDALKIKVFLDGDRIKIYGSIATVPSSLNGSNIPLNYSRNVPFCLPVKVGVR